MYAQCTQLSIFIVRLLPLEISYYSVVVVFGELRGKLKSLCRIKSNKIFFSLQHNPSMVYADILSYMYLVYNFAGFCIAVSSGCSKLKKYI